MQQPQQHIRQLSGTPPTSGSSATNSPKTKLKNQLNVTSSNNNNNNIRLRSKESSPELLNDPRGEVLSLEKKIRDAVQLLSKNKFNVLDEVQNASWQKEAAEKEKELQVQSRGVQAMEVLVNYLVHDVSTIICILRIELARICRCHGVWQDRGVSNGDDCWEEFRNCLYLFGLVAAGRPSSLGFYRRVGFVEYSVQVIIF